MLLLNSFVQKILFALIGVVLTIALLPMRALHWAAPRWDGLTDALNLLEPINKGAWYEPGKKQENPYFLPGDERFSFTPGDHWTLGFGKRNLTEDPQVIANAKAGRYYVAGYGRMKSDSIMDDLFAKAIYLDDNTGRGGILYASVDCIGLSDTDVNQIRALVWDWARAAKIKSIQIAAMHVHSGIDTVGLWADIPEDGKDPAFQRHLIEQTALALRAAYDNRQDGRLFVADTEMPDMMEDSRAPEVFDSKLTRFRFEPSTSGRKDVYLLAMGCHPEMMGPNNPQISADFPAYAAQYIHDKQGAEAMFLQGAQGGLITVPGLPKILDEHRAGNVAYGPSMVPDFGKKVARYALGEIGTLSAEAELPAVLNIASAQVDFPIENIALLLSAKLRILNHGIYTHCGKYYIPCEISYLRLGDRAESVDVLVVPGELSPEIAFGGFFDKTLASTGKDYPRPAIFAALRGYEFASRRQIVFGLANNFIGYIIPENDFYTHFWFPYLNIGTDKLGRGHYEETVSAGPKTAQLLSEGFDGLFQRVG
ncbi:MAG: hypothetical protein FWC27_14855 [Firmicutes bacterium]|nr:hypothetical protein [Bacillota bacterium]